LPQHFTDVADLSISTRQKLLGRAFSGQVIVDVLDLLSDKFAKNVSEICHNKQSLNQYQ